MFTALLDTCVLWPSKQRDFLLSLAVEGIYRPVWSPAILSELEYEEAEKLIRRGVPPDQAQRRARWLIQRMRAGFDDSEVHGWEGPEGTYGLPDEDDEHVLAAAVVAGAGAIVTANLQDFPPNAVPAGIDVLPVSRFCADAVGFSPAAARRAVEEMAARSGKTGPRYTPAELLDHLEHRYALTDAVALLR